jgi:glucosylceramidase
MVTPFRSLLSVLAAVVASAVVSCGSATAPSADAGASAAPRPAPKPTFTVSSPTDTSRQLQTLPTSPASAGSTVDVVLHPARTRQVWWGTGAALTDASVELLDGRPGVVRTLFDPKAARGARLNMLRLPLSATDFSPRMWSWSWDGRTATPSPEARRALDLVTSDVLPLRPGLRVVGAAWSAPAAMKASGTLRGGALADDQVGAYGDLLVAQAQWLKRHGVPLWATSLGNEPGHSSDYPTMTMTDAQMATLASSVGPRLDGLGTRLWAVDHNWYDRNRADAVVAGSDDFDGAAFHCYAGHPDQMAGLAMPRMITECTGTVDDATGTFGWDAKNLVADAIHAGSSGLMMWNLALDAEHGPADTGARGGCKLCRGVVTVTPSGMTREPEFFTLAHLSRAAAPGAHVIDADAPEWLSIAAFRNPDGTVGVFGQNRSGSEQTVRIAIGDGGGRRYVVRPGEMFSYRAPVPS